MNTNKFNVGDKVRVVATSDQLEEMGLSPLDMDKVSTVVEIDWYGADSLCSLDEQGYLLEDTCWYKESHLKLEKA